MQHWKELESLIPDQYSISWQQGLEDMEEYYEWINSCRLIVTNDSFGLHIAIALKKKLICLFGPTHHKENYLYELGVSLYPENFCCDEFPCRVHKCIKYEESCMSLIAPSLVLTQIENLL
jgi:heptosyltransferase-2